MSEPLLKAIIQLFAIVAKEDEVTTQERDQIEAFLVDHLNKNAVPQFLKEFDEYSDSIIIDDTIDIEEEQRRIEGICVRINEGLTQKQKVVIILELMGIILADGHISKREEELLRSIGSSFNVSKEEIDLIKKFVIGKSHEDFDAPNILIIDAKKYDNPAFKHLKREGLNGFIAILHLAKADTYFIKYQGSTDLYLNGVPLKSGKKGVLAIGSTIRAERTSPVYYGDIISRFIKNENERPITFEARNISYRFKNGKLGLRNINIAEESGKLIGLMGASGAGKSTLLHVLNGSDRPTEGQVLINNIDIHKQESLVKGVIGFVPQDDLLIEELTVYENLYYAARLCFDQLKDEEIKDLVIKTLNNLGLYETKDLKVGSPLEKTISGGQRKRLNIGLELLREPSILFVDEPTSGLSSRDSENIMDLLKELSLKGKLIFVVIHQPSSDIFKMFDKLVILDTGGYQIYYGNPVEAVVYFKEIINLINSDQGECHECGNVNPEQIFNIIETKVINEYGNFTNERKVSPEQWNQYFMEKTSIPKVGKVTTAPESTLNIPDRLKQLKLFTTRDLLSKLSNKQYLIINLLEAPLLALILAYIVRYYNTYHSEDPTYLFSKNPNIPAYLFMSVIVALFMGLTVSAEEIIRDQKILKREAFLHLSRGSYISSKIAILFTLSAIQTFTFVIVGNAILQIDNMFLIHWTILFSTSCLANIMGLNISSAFNSAVTIYIMIPILLIPQLVLSGVVVRFDKLNPDLSSTGEVPLVGDMMASRWAFEAAMVSQFRDNEYEEMFYPYEKVMAESDYKKIYYIPTLETKLEYSLNNFRKNTPEIRENLAENLQILSSELEKELQVVGHDKFEHLELLIPEKFDSTAYQKTYEFLEKLRAFYVARYNKADQAKDKLIVSMTETTEEREAFEKLKDRYRNETIAEIVKNQNEPHRILEAHGELVQKIFPIYKDPEPKHLLDYRSQFYVPKKHILGGTFDTLYFNIGVIWLMSIVLIFTLYYNIPRKIINGIESLARRS
ncbi:ATP-binding cassette domain-containing protein [Fulvivirga kasyanovii]|uniref:ATP-binding cassette domain-containing protein n=1 Tax=Fulvivirga kasyanovii TaxID=396812 RepID=A0ABW9RS90_9BACT|nr:ATP-binding cassette domain-containing protein [Fulvivirga kasyanovii]MTI27032.1 ATP-binding cassette domain-containing protein [Fulvivirga kasyanovii]